MDGADSHPPLPAATEALMQAQDLADPDLAGEPERL